MKVRRLLCSTLAMLVAIAMPLEAFAWGKGHRLIRLWAVARQPQWQRQLVGQQSLDRLCNDYTSLQDKHAGGKSPELDPTASCREGGPGRSLSRRQCVSGQIPSSD